jgi:hypothetical protein
MELGQSTRVSGGKTDVKTSGLNDFLKSRWAGVMMVMIYYAWGANPELWYPRARLEQQIRYSRRHGVNGEWVHARFRCPVARPA